MNDEVSYYVEFKGTDGHMHYAVHKYNRVSGIVTMMRDLKFN